jgi:GT2 family glycosyltransferase
VSAPTTVSVCIRTRDRLDALERALESVRRSRHPASEVVVSDDSEGHSARPLVEGRFPEVLYVEGPRRGIAANGNRVVSRASGDLVLLLDDDVVLDPDALGSLLACARSRDPRLGAGSRVIATSPVVEHDIGLLEPREQGFLGFQEKRYRPGDPVKTIVAGSVLFPRALFDEVSFDERLTVFEEVDFATRAAARGYEIVLCRDVVNDHFPIRPTEERYGPEIDAARIYVTLKRYAVTDRRPLRALAFLLCAPAHLIGASLKTRGLGGLAYSGRALALAAGHIGAYVRERRA